MYNTAPFDVNLMSNARNKIKKDIKSSNTKDNIKSNNRFMYYTNKLFPESLPQEYKEASSYNPGKMTLKKTDTHQITGL